MKRAVHLDCYRASRFLCTRSLSEMIEHIAGIGGVQGVEASSESLLSYYPDVSDAFCDQWNELLDTHNLQAVTLGTYIDRLQFRDHAMTIEETADAICRDLRIAKKLGFQNMRIMHDIPLEAVQIALPLAEDLDIRMLDELLSPATIQRRAGRKGEDCAIALDFIARTGTKHFGLMINLGLFQNQPNPTQILDVMLEDYTPAAAQDEYASVMAHFRTMEFPAFEEWINANHPKLNTNRELFQRMFGVRLFGHSVELSDIQLLGGSLLDVYAKFTKMIPSCTGWIEPSIPYGNVIKELEHCGYDGCITSLRMGTPTLSLGRDLSIWDVTDEERLEVEHHQEMLKQWIK